MSSKRVRLISLTGIILIALILGVSVLFNLFSKDTREIDLPDTSASASATDGVGTSANNGLDHVKITKDNVQAVIATLKRHEAYSRQIIIEDDYSSYDFTVAVNGVNTALTLTSGPDKKHIIVTGDKLYIWYDGEKTPYERPIASPEDEKRSSDEYQKIMSYEDVVAIDKSSVTAADYVEKDGDIDIYVQYVTDQLHYTTNCYISIDTGLLTRVEQYDGNKLIYMMTSKGFDPAVPDISAFSLPDGKSAVNFNAP